MTDQTRKIVLPAYLVRRCEAFRIVKGEAVSYILRDKLHDKTYDFEPWQFFILEVLPGCESLEKLQSVFKDRFDRALTKKEVDELFESLAERKILEDSALQHPLLKPFALLNYDIVDGKGVPKEEPGPPPLRELTGLKSDQKIILPSFLSQRLKAHRTKTDAGTTYFVTDDVHDKNYHFAPWQFFLIEIVPECKTYEALQKVFEERFARPISKQDLDEFFASLADRKMFAEEAMEHPLLKPFAMRTYEVVDGKAVLKPQAEKVNPSVKAPPAAAPAPKPEIKELPAGVRDMVGMDPDATGHMWPLFDPRPIYRRLVPIIKPLRYFAYALPVMIFIALMLIYKNSDVLSRDLRNIQINMDLLAHLVFSLFTLNLTATIVFGCTAYAYNAHVERFCITNYIGFIPRFVNKVTGYERMTRREFMLTHGSSLLYRVFVFCTSVFVWHVTANRQGSLHDAATAMLLTSMGSLMVETGNPLVKGHAYFILSAYLNEPHLRGKAYKALLNKFKAGVYSSSDSTILSLYAMAFVAYAFALTTFVVVGLGKFLAGRLHLGGSAIIITVTLLAYLFWKNYVNLKKFGESYERTMQFEMWRKRTLIEKGEAEGEVKTVKPSYWGRAALVCLFIALFIPYPYQPTGSFTIYPARKQVMSTDTPGLIEQVFFDGGESVKKGTVLATLAHDDYQAAIKVYAAKVEEQKWVIANLKAKPKPEEVQLAVEIVELARTHELFSREKAPRLEKLYKVGAVSFEEYDEAVKQHEADLNTVQEKVAALELVKVGATPEQIAAEEAKLISLQEELNTYIGKLDRTTLRMPFDGNILTLHLMDRINSYLDKGQPFAAIEYTGTVTAQVDVAEPDAQYIEMGAKVRIRPAAYFEREFVGTVTTIDRDITDQNSGNVIKVIATIDNPQGLLKTGMSGEGRVDGPTMPVWEAFSQAAIRFVEVQLWSWIP